MSAPPENTLADPEQLIADLQCQLAECKVERDEALERETATAEVLQVINSSPGDLAPVFDAILDKALRLCEATHGHIWRVEGQQAHAVALRGDARFIASMPRESRTDLPGRPLTRLARGERVVRLPDLTKEEIYRTNQAYREFIDATGIRSAVMVALRKDEALIGAIAVHRKEVIPVTEKQIALLQNFAEQAVIAMENARLLTETSEALEQQTATAEVLQVINSSPGDLAPVFDAMLDKAMRLCEANHAHLYTLDGDQGKTAAARGDPRFIDWFMEQGPQRVIRGSAVDRLCQGEPFVHMLDATAVEPYRTNPWFRELIDRSGCRTSISVPLRKDRALLGTIHLYRPEVRPFTDKQIALLQNFAAQAVIAMENARLLGELRQRTNDLQESLEYQTATSDVLNVISRSTADVKPVLDTVAETAARLCGADTANIAIREGEVYRFVSASALDPELWAALRQRTVVLGRETLAGRVALEGRVVHIADIRADPDLAVPDVVAAGLRTGLGVPLLREGAVLGTISLARKRVEPFTERQIELVRTFADQAVIAIENARLLGELQARTRDLEESLEYQTATSDVLKVISRSTRDVQPVLDTVVETAALLCGAELASITIREGEVYRPVSAFATDPEHWAAFRQRTIVPGRDSIVGRVALQVRVVHVEDLAADPDFAVPETVAAGLRTVLGVPLLREVAVLGTISLARKRVEPFTERQIEVVRTFADQAVIAMENARLLGELQARTRDLEESLEYQTATSDVLQVISRSTSNRYSTRWPKRPPGFAAPTSQRSRYARARSTAMWRVRSVQRSPSIGTPCASEPLSPAATAWPAGCCSKAGSRMSRTSALTRTSRCPRVWRPGYAPPLECRFCARRPCSARLVSRGNGSNRSASGRSSSCGPLPIRRSSRWRMRGCSLNCERARATSKSRSNTRPQLATYSTSSAVRPPTCKRCWTQ